MDILKVVIACVAGYLLGSLNFAIICSKIFQKDDVREHGSGNAGITNYLRNYGGLSAVIVVIGDLGKCILAVNLAEYLFEGTLIAGYDIGEMMKFVAGFFVMLGHMWPLYFGFKGGKGVLSVAALIIALDWRAAIIGLSIFAIIVITTKYVSLGSIIAVTSVWPLILWFYREAPLLPAYLIIYGAIVAIVVIRHIPNIKRLVNHTESKFSIGGKKKK